MPSIPYFSVQVRVFSDFQVAVGAPPLTFTDAHDIFYENFSFPDEIKARVEGVLEETCAGDYLAMHYRGTDKCSEAKRPSQEEFLAHFVELARIRYPGIASVFVATDEPSFLAAARSQLTGYRIFVNSDRVRPSGTEPVHLSRSARNDPRSLTEDAVVNALLLSRARLLVKTPSILSGWAKVLNPALDAVLVGELHPHAAWFPDAQLPRSC